jgi:hypothetical protein
MLAPLDNQVIFKKAFQDKIVFTEFVRDILGISAEVEKIETEKKFFPKIGNIDFAYDIFAETLDHRLIIEIQRVDYDHNFDRFLHYHNMAIAELQRSSEEYKVSQTVYTIVILTAPYMIREKDGQPIKDEVLLSECDPRTLDGKTRRVYGHKLVFLNPNFRDDVTPQQIRDWLILFYESVHRPKEYQVNLQNRGISRTVEIIDYDRLDPEEIRDMKIEASRKATLTYVAELARENERKLRQEAQQQAEYEKQRAEQEKQRAEQERTRAELAEEQLENAIKALVSMGLSETEARQKLTSR